MDIGKFIYLIVAIVVCVIVLPVAISSINASLGNYTAIQQTLLLLVPTLLVIVIVVAIVVSMKFKK